MDNQQFKNGDPIIWDSGFGYEIGYFIGKGVRDNSYLVDMKTGIIKGKVSHDIQDIKHYTPELARELGKKYTYNVGAKLF